jgi:hypothetical protein
MSPFSAPFSWGTHKREAAAPKAKPAAFWEGPALFGRNRESRSREVLFLHPACGTAGAGIWPEAVPRKWIAEKGAGLLNCSAMEAVSEGPSAQRLWVECAVQSAAITRCESKQLWERRKR